MVHGTMRLFFPSHVQTGILRIAFGLAVALIGLSIYVHFSIGFWGDQDWELLVARMWLSGKRLYVDHVPVTAPLLFYLYALPVRLSQWLPGIQDFQALVGMTLLMTLATGALCVSMLRQHPGFEMRSRRRQFALLFGYLLIYRVLSPFYADREHWMMILIFPYLLLNLPGLDEAVFGRTLRIVVGMLAAVGFLLKPHGLLLLAAINLVTLLRRRTLAPLARAETLTVIALGVAYAALVWLTTPDYFTRVLPMAFFTYSAIQGGTQGVYPVTLCLLLAAVQLRPLDRSAYHRDILALLALLPFYYAYARINNGWAYSYQPVMTLILLLNCFALWEHRDAGLTSSPLRHRIGVVLCLFNLVFQGFFPLRYFHQVETHPCRGDAACPGYYQPFLDVLKTTPKARSFGSIGMDFAVWTRVSRLSGAAWQTRFPQLWMLPRLYIANDAYYAAHQDIFHYVAESLAEDLNRNMPDVVFVEVSTTLYRIRMQRPVEWVEDFSTVPVFKDAWSHYVLNGIINQCDKLEPPEDAITERSSAPGVVLKETNCIYRVYRRQN